jgi:integrase/recombinase XerD
MRSATSAATFQGIRNRYRLSLLGPVGGVSVGPSAQCAPHGYLRSTPKSIFVKALRVELADTLAYWTVVDEDWVPVPAADAYLRHLRLGADRAEGTTRVYAGDLALFLGWCATGGRDLLAAARDLHLFVGMLRTTPVRRVGSGWGGVRGPGRINHVLAAVREFYCHALACGGVDAAVLGLLFEVSDDRYLPAELKGEGSGLRYRARPRHVQRVRRRVYPVRVRQDEVESLLRCARSWRDRFLLVLLWFCGLRIGEALGLRRSDLHLGASARPLGCPVPGAHLHVVSRDGNPNGARAKTGDRHVPVHAEVLACYDHYLAERGECRPAEVCDFVLVTLFHQPAGRPMSDHTVRQWMAQTSRQAGLDRVVRPHMFRHATASELLARGAGLDVVKELLGHASIRSTEAYLHPDHGALRAAVDNLGPLRFSTGEEPR